MTAAERTPDLMALARAANGICSEHSECDECRDARAALRAACTPAAILALGRELDEARRAADDWARMVATYAVVQAAADRVIIHAHGECRCCDAVSNALDATRPDQIDSMLARLSALTRERDENAADVLRLQGDVSELRAHVAELEGEREGAIAELANERVLLIGTRARVAAADALAEACEGMQAFIGVMYGSGPDAIVPDSVLTPLAIPVKLGDIMRDAAAALARYRAGGEAKPDWCTCNGTHECEGHRA